MKNMCLTGFADWFLFEQDISSRAAQAEKYFSQKFKKEPFKTDPNQYLHLVPQFRKELSLPSTQGIPNSYDAMSAGEKEEFIKWLGIHWTDSNFHTTYLGKEKEKPDAPIAHMLIKFISHVSSNAWLVHINQSPIFQDAIWRDGFKKGSELAYSHITTKSTRPKNGEWAFAYLAKSNDTKMYDYMTIDQRGVLFRSNEAIYVEHNGDREYQVMFPVGSERDIVKYRYRYSSVDTGGKDANRQPIRKGIRVFQVLDEDDKPFYETGSIREMIRWLEQNFDHLDLIKKKSKENSIKKPEGKSSQQHPLLTLAARLRSSKAVAAEFGKPLNPEYAKRQKELQQKNQYSIDGHIR